MESCLKNPAFKQCLEITQVLFPVQLIQLMTGDRCPEQNIAPIPPSLRPPDQHQRRLSDHSTLAKAPSVSAVDASSSLVNALATPLRCWRGLDATVEQTDLNRKTHVIVIFQTG